MSDPFWTWSLETYARESVANACLDLQDEHQQNVPLLLWAVWCAVEGVDISDDLARESVGLARAWADSLIAPLRVVRRRLKSPISDGDETQRLGLYSKIKALELEAEQILMDELALLMPDGFISNRELIQPVNADALPNLLAVSCMWSPDTMPPSFARLLQALSEGEFLRYTS